MKLIGRETEIGIINKCINSEKSEFIAVYGRRRVGKTFLIRTHFNNTFQFQLTGIANTDTERQLLNFNTALAIYKKQQIEPIAKNWFEAFQQLRTYLEGLKTKKKVIFIDELPWLDTPKSDFVQSLEHFWNSWAAHEKNIKLIVCGSAANWMLNKLINAKGGLHNRVTIRIKVNPFTLKECKQFLRAKSIAWNDYQIVTAYMALGGIPYYLDFINKGWSANQAIDALFFEENAALRDEFQNLYASLFRNEKKHVAAVKALSTKNKGLTRSELITVSGLSNGGSTTQILDELEQCGFIRKYTPIGKKNRDSLYQLTDQYTLFYYKFIENKTGGNGSWVKQADSPLFKAWSGYAFEQVCFCHIKNIKSALGIDGIQTEVSSWTSSTSEKGAQIDLVIERKDQVINVCEMKFSTAPFTITKAYAENLRNKLGAFRLETKTKKAVFLTLITTYGVTENQYKGELVQNEIEMGALFG